MEQTTCAAIFISPTNRLWVGTNKKDSTAISVMSSIQKLLSSKMSVKSSRKELVKDDNVMNILGLSANQGRKKGQYDKELVKNADKMIHWIKKVLSLKEHLSDDEKEPLSIIARCLRDNKIDYFFTGGVHAEMNLMNKLYDEKLLYEHAGYIGISKACCLKCASALEAVNCFLTSMGKSEKFYQANECPFHVYHWLIPNFINDIDLLEIFLGAEAFKIYNNSTKQKNKFLKIIKTLSNNSITRKGEVKTGIENTPTESSNMLEWTEQGKGTIKKGKRNVKFKVAKRGYTPKRQKKLGNKGV